MNWKKIAIISLDVCIACYLLLAMTSWNKPDDHLNICTEVKIAIEEDIVDGFLTPDKVKQMLHKKRLYPVTLPMSQVNTRQIEESLCGEALVEKAECYKTQGGQVCIDIRQRIPVIRVKADNGDDYYVDSHGEVMPQTNYACNLIVATGHISKSYAGKTLAPLAKQLLGDNFWKNQVEQLNVLADGSVEMVPRVGDHIAYIGQPTNVASKLDRLRKFYRYGLSEAGWNKYSRVSVEFDNQIICKRRNYKAKK
ncbi:MAG: cell division protein FtsQ [Prevotella sp.]|nr:cell division protein FtsQ [Prevotella sp.]